MNKIIKEQFELNVSGYSQYVDRGAEIVANIVANSTVLSMITPLTGHKANTQVDMNYMTGDLVFSNADCVSEATGDSTVISPRPTQIKRWTAREEICLDLLDAKFGNSINGNTPGADNETLPFEGLYIDLKLAKTAKILEKAAWQGDTDIQGATNNLNKVDGWLKQADSETSALGYYQAITATNLLPANIYATIQTLVNNRTEDTYGMDDVKIFISQPDYASLQQAILALHGTFATGSFLNTGDQNQTGRLSLMFPGTNVEIIADAGLNGNRSVFMIPLSELKFLTDMESDKESADSWYSKDKAKYITEIKFAIGFNYALPEHVGYLKFGV